MTPDACACLWCGSPFVPRRGGKPQRFCRPACRRAFDAAGRKYVAEAIADGTLTMAALRKRQAATRALLLASSSPAPIDRAKEPVPVSSAARPDEAAELLRDLVIAVADLPDDVFAALPDEVVDRLVRYVDGSAEKPASAVPVPRPGEEVIMLRLDKMTAMQVRELRWGDPFHEATPTELAAAAGAVIRGAIPWLMAQGRP
jgi:hypothetical protein